MFFKKVDEFNKKGAALIWMLLVFTVSMIVMTTVIYLARQDLRETVNLEERIQTYYIASAGIDLTYAALMDSSNNPKKIEAAINLLKSGTSSAIEDTIVVKNNGEIKGTSIVKIERVVVDEQEWLQIISRGKLQGKNTEVVTTMLINESNYNQIVRQKFGE